MESDKSQERIETFGYMDFSGLDFIQEEGADTIEKLIKVTGASEESIIKGLEDLKQKGLINVEYENEKIKHVSLSERGTEFYNIPKDIDISSFMPLVSRKRTKI